MKLAEESYESKWLLFSGDRGLTILDEGDMNGMAVPRYFGAKKEVQVTIVGFPMWTIRSTIINHP